MKELLVLKKQNISKDCMVCGYDNEFALKAEFYELEGGILCAIIKGKNEYQSYPSRMHGGMISAILDETIGRAIQIKDANIWGVTGELNIKFKKPVPLFQKLKVFAYITRDTSRLFVGKGFIEDDEGNILAEASATYVKLALDKIIVNDSNELDYVPKIYGNEPKSIVVYNDKYFQALN